MVFCTKLVVILLTLSLSCAGRMMIGFNGSVGKGFEQEVDSVSDISI